MAQSKIFLCILAATSIAFSQNLTEQYRDTANRLIDAALADKDGYEKLAYLTDRIGNRLSGSASLERAITWAAETMKRDGLSNVRTIPVKVPHWVRGAESLKLIAPEAKPLHMLGLGMSVGTPPGGITAEVVVVSDFDDMIRLGRDQVRGKIVLFNAPYKGYGPTVTYRSSGPSRAAALGAVAVLVRSITPMQMQIPHTGSLTYDADQAKIPAAAITLEDAMMLARFYAAKVPIRVTLQMSAHQEPDADSFDVMGEIPGREHPEEIVAIGGHIDSWDVGRGAQDDGSGIMAALEAVAIIKKLGLQPRRTLRVVFWVNEENGARGGAAYRAWVGEKIANHVAAIEMDGGAESPRGFGYGGEEGGGRGAKAPSTEEQSSTVMLLQIAKLLERIGAGTISPGGGGTDIAPLTRDGVASLGLQTSGAHYFDWHHTEADTLDKVDPDDFRKCIAAMAVMSYAIADMPGRLAGSK